MNATLYTATLIIIVIVFTFLNLRALQKAGAPRHVIWIVGFGLLLWLMLAYTLVTQDLFGTVRAPEIVFAAIIFTVVVLGLLAQKFWQPFSAAIDTMSTETLLSLQLTRPVFGLMFFLTAGLPTWFQLIGGLGDIAAGVGAFLALDRLRKNRTNVSRAIIEGNIVGVLDFAVVLTLGFLIMRNQPVSDVFLLIPLYVVPIFLLLHIFSLQKLGLASSQKLSVQS